SLPSPPKPRYGSCTHVVCHLIRDYKAMRNILMFTAILIGLTIVGCSQTRKTEKSKLTADFFYGAWGDSSKTENGGQGIIFGTKNDFYLILNGDITGGDNFGKNLKLTYNLNLDKSPVEVEILSQYLHTEKIKSQRLVTIEVIDKRHIIWNVLDDNRKIIDSPRLTRAPNSNK
ncbi:MAG TPA: hypothetical protein PLX35_03665, partial [Cyclobacteriaceae bacterium]|nr:hypothetical protein [Cyclobacteriaceae bacterium]